MESQLGIVEGQPADLAGERWQAALFPEHALGRPEPFELVPCVS